VWASLTGEMRRKGLDVQSLLLEVLEKTAKRKIGGEGHPGQLSPGQTDRRNGGESSFVSGSSRTKMCYFGSETP
jgi:hypothetical protein